MKFVLTTIASFTLALASFALASAANPDVYSPGYQPCSLTGVSYAAPSAGYVSYSQSATGCTYSPWGARLEAYFWDGGWWMVDGGRSSSMIRQMPTTPEPFIAQR